MTEATKIPPTPIANSHIATITCIVPALAQAIGLNESIVLMQIDYWINQSSNAVYRDGRWWTYQSLETMQQQAFPYWSMATISRTLKKLQDANLIIVGNYNIDRSDRTQWYALSADAMQDMLDAIGVDEAPCEKDLPGHIYLVRAITPANHYKIGMSSDPIRRIDRMDVILPFPLENIHTIKTNQMRAGERYWHEMFAEKKLKGEWFALTDGDVRLFCGTDEQIFGGDA